MIFAITMIVPLAFAFFGNDAALVGLRHARSVDHLLAGGCAVAGHAPLPARTAAARRLPAGDAGVDRAAGLRHAAAAAAPARAERSPTPTSRRCRG
ncbi:MAG: hypothetical protein MZW92_12760 [Comamonadaceae bacterium]|nr:hypothetical protein [Comamonadaceae bacterium]